MQSNYIQVLSSRIAQAKKKLELILEDLVLATADLEQVEHLYEQALVRASQQDEAERRTCENALAHYHRRLAQWKLEQEALYQAEIDKHRRPANQALVFLACFVSFGVYLALELNEIRGLQSKRDHPPYGDEQYRWLKEMDTKERQLNYLRSLSAPRQTQEMKDLQREQAFLKKKRDTLEQQARFKEVEIEEQERLRDAALAQGGSTSGPHVGSAGQTLPTAASSDPKGQTRPIPHEERAAHVVANPPQPGAFMFFPAVSNVQHHVIDAEYMALDDE